MHDPIEEDREEPPFDWDAWASGSARRNRWWIIWATAMMIALVLLYFSGNSTWFPR